MTLKRAISAGIGLFIALIGMSNAGLLSNTTGTIIGLGDLSSPTALLAVLSLVLLVVLLLKKVKGALFFGIIVTTIVANILQFVLMVDVGISAPDFGNLAFKMDGFGAFVTGFGELFTFSDGFGVGILSVITVLISLTTVDMFDTVGTLVGTAEKAGFLDKDGNLPRGDKAMLADAIATVTGAIFGTSTVTTYVESTAGVSEGGRTGLTSMVVAALFVVSIVLFPIIGLVPTAATAPVLIIVGVMMVSSLKGIEWGDMEEAIPAFMTVVMMPFAYSISDGIGLGFIFYCLVKLVAGKGNKVSPILYGVAALFVLRYIILATSNA
jgi:AGZA family xanthine/uracil permease-like MFS transporter